MEEIRSLFESLISNPAEAREKFNREFAKKLQEVIEERRKKIAAGLFEATLKHYTKTPSEWKRSKVFFTNKGYRTKKPETLKEDTKSTNNAKYRDLINSYEDSIKHEREMLEKALTNAERNKIKSRISSYLAKIRQAQSRIID